MSIEELYDGRGKDHDLEPTVDIVAVHGLNPTNKKDHAKLAWQDEKSGHLWLRDALPASLPTVRTLLYSYDSSPVFGAEKQRFIHHASEFLQCLSIVRKNEQKRPLIMMGHSLGGILIKQALVNAHNNPRFRSIKDATFGLVFFGTPHSGPTEDLQTRFAKACVSIAQSMPLTVSNDIMKALKKGSLFSDILDEHWRHQLELYQFVSFWEGEGNIVPFDSATLGLSGNREAQVKLNANHRNMCRFDPNIAKDMQNYVLVVEQISTLCFSHNFLDSSKDPIPEYGDILASLQPLAANPRSMNLPEKHAESFEWIWKEGPDGPGFSEWLTSLSESIYWITGLPGAGKSTMMSYLYEDPRLTELLPKQHLQAVLGYFFYELGESQEKTFAGLLASILNQILRSFNDLAAFVLPMFRKIQSSNSTLNQVPQWNEQQLRKALKAIKGSSSISRNVLLFVDGLDECTGNHREQLDLLVEWINSSGKTTLQVKLLLASRPLQEMEIRLAAYPKCRIHHWTSSDIQSYVLDKLSIAKSLLLDSSQHTRIEKYQSLVNQIAVKAEGVFLWVEVIINNLIIGVEEGDTMAELEAHLDSLPPSIEALYGRILLQIPDEYVADCINYVNLILENQWEDFGLLEFTLACRDPKACLAPELADNQDAYVNLEDFCHQIEVRIRSRCRGLLQIEEDPEEEELSSQNVEPLRGVTKKNVKFLHLTVRDYLKRKDVMESLLCRAHSKKVKSTIISQMSGFLSLLKLIPSPELLVDLRGRSTSRKLSQIAQYSSRHGYDFVASRIISDFFFYASQVPMGSREIPGNYILELDRICTLGNVNWRDQYHNQWRRPGGYITSPLSGINLVSLALSRGCDNYVFEEITNRRFDPLQKGMRPLLHLFFDRSNFGYNMESLQLLSILFDRGVSPNEKFQEESSWQHYLKMFQRNYLLIGKRWETMGRMTKLLLDNRADPNAMVRLEGESIPALIFLISRLTAIHLDVKEIITAFLSHGVDLYPIWDGKTDILTEAENNDPALKDFILETLANMEQPPSKRQRRSQPSETEGFPFRDTT